jgi:hypothetical protein
MSIAEAPVSSASAFTSIENHDRFMMGFITELAGAMKKSSR